MQQWRAGTRLPLAVDALTGTVDDPAVQRLVSALGGEPAMVEERLVGEPPRRARRERFASGGELFLHDGVVAAVALHLAPVEGVPRGLDASRWLGTPDGVDTLDALVAAIGTRRRFAGISTPYLELDEANARCDYRDRRGWNEPGNLLAVTVTTEQPGVACQPDDDFCPACGDVVVRAPGGAMDLDATVAALAAAVADDRLREDRLWVALADLRPLHASGSMDRVEAQLGCATCRRVLCLTLHRETPPTLPRPTRPGAARWTRSPRSRSGATRPASRRRATRCSTSTTSRVPGSSSRRGASCSSRRATS